MYNLIVTMRWSDLYSDLMWNEFINLNQVLPKAGDNVEVSLYWNEDYVRAGEYHLLWLPPHSEHNSLHDRPYEFLNGRVFTGEISNSSNPPDEIPGYSGVTFDFHIKQITLLTDLIEKMDETLEYSIPKVGLLNGESKSIWEICHERRTISSSRSGNLIYLSASDNESAVEAMLLEKDGNIYLVYHGDHPPAYYFTHLIKYKLKATELELFSGYVSNPARISENPLKFSNEEIEGLAYC